MTTDQILALPAGRELDALVAERVFDWQDVRNDYPWPSGNDTAREYWMGRRPDEKGLRCVEAYSTEIAAASEVLEKLHERFTNVALCGDNGWGLTVWNIGCDGEHRDVCGPYGGADNPALAICRTALLAVAG